MSKSSSASDSKGVNVDGGGGGGGCSHLSKIMAILIILVLLATVVFILMWDAKNFCERIKEGKLLVMGSTPKSNFYVIDTSFRGIEVPVENLRLEEMPKNASCDLRGGKEFSLEKWANDSLRGDSPYNTTAFILERKKGTVIVVTSENRQRMAGIELRLNPHNSVHDATVSGSSFFAGSMPSRAVFVTVNSSSENEYVALYSPENGTLSRTKFDLVITLGDDFSQHLTTVPFPKGFSLDGGYQNSQNITDSVIGWSRKNGLIYLMNTLEKDVVKLSFDEFFICELPGGGLGSFLFKLLIIGGILFFLMIVVGALCVCQRCMANEGGGGDRSKKSQQIGKSKRAKESTAGQSSSSPVNQIKLAPSIAGKLEDKKSVRKLSTSWSRASQSSSSSVSSTAGGGTSTLSTASSATSKNSKLSAVSGVSGVGNASSVNSALGGSSFAGYGNSNMASAVSAAGSSSAISTATSNTSKAGMSNVGASSAISSTAASKAGSSVAVSSTATSSTAASSKAATSKPATPTNKAGATSKAHSPVSKFAASSSKGSTSPGAASKASAASSKALSPQPAAAKKATSPAGTSKQFSSKASSAADSKSNSKLK